MFPRSMKKVYGSRLTILWSPLSHLCHADLPGTINLYGPEYTLMKLQYIPQPKVQYNHQLANKVAVINFWQFLLNYWYFSRNNRKSHCKVGTAITKELVINLGVADNKLSDYSLSLTPA